jgi:hypothetical protein
MDLTVRFVADPMNLRTEILPRSCGTLIEERLNHIVVLLKRRPDLSLLVRSQLQIIRNTSKLLVDRLQCINLLKLLPRRGLLDPIVLSDDSAGRSG